MKVWAPRHKKIPGLRLRWPVSLDALLASYQNIDHAAYYLGVAEHALRRYQRRTSRPKTSCTQRAFFKAGFTAYELPECADSYDDAKSRPRGYPNRRDRVWKEVLEDLGNIHFFRLSPRNTRLTPSDYTRIQREDIAHRALVKKFLLMDAMDERESCYWAHEILERFPLKQIERIVQQRKATK